MSAISIKKLHTLEGHKDCLYTLCGYQSDQFFSAGGDGMVVLWDLKNPEIGRMIASVPNSIYALAYHDSRQLLVVGQNYSGIHLIDVENSKEVASVALTDQAIFDIQCTDQAIYVAAADGTLMVLDWSLNVLNRIRLSEKSARCLAVSETYGQLAVGYSDCYIRVFSLDDLRLLREFEAHSISVFTVKYHPYLPLLMSGSRDARLKTWDISQDFLEVNTIPAHLYAINHIDFAPSAQFFATCSMDKSIKVWDSSEFKLLKVIDKARHAGHGTSVNKLLWMNYRDWLVSCSDDRTISVWDVNFEEL